MTDHHLEVVFLYSSKFYKKCQVKTREEYHEYKDFYKFPLLQHVCYENPVHMMETHDPTEYILCDGNISLTLKTKFSPLYVIGSGSNFTAPLSCIHETQQKIPFTLSMGAVYCYFHCIDRHVTKFHPRKPIHGYERKCHKTICEWH